MRKFIILVLIILMILPLLKCNITGRCTQEYSANLVNKKFPPYNLYRNSLYVSVDSINNNNFGCAYNVFTFLPLNDSTISHKGILTIDKKCIYLQMTDIKTDKFPLIKFSSSIGEDTEIKIKYGNETITKINTLENIITTKNGIKVYVFKFHKLFYLFVDNNRLADKLDVVLFATEAHGLIGSYLTGIERDKKIMIAPAGEILADYIDYSEYEMRLIQ